MERSILVVDNDDDFRAMLCEYLYHQGFATTEARNGAEGLTAFRAGFHNALITDYGMPRINGGELIRALHRKEPGLPTLLVTAGISDRELLSLMREPRFLALRKPFLADTLLQALKLVMEAAYVPRKYPPRSAYRFDLNLDVRINETDVAKLVSLSKTGCFVVTEHRAPVGATLSVHCQKMSLTGRAVWCRDAGIGIKFENAESDACGDLEEFLIREMHGRGLGWFTD